MIRLLDNLPVAVFALTGDGRPFYSNQASRELLGRDVDPVIGVDELSETYGVYVAGTDQLYPTHALPVVRALAGERSTVTDIQIRRPGRSIELEVSAFPFHDPDGSVAYAVAIFWDITERRKTERALASVEEQLRQSQRMDELGRLAGGVAHDFNNFLSVIRGSAEMLASDLPEGGPHRASLDEIIAAADHSAALTRQLLAFGRRQTLVVEIIDFNTTVRNMDRLLRRIFPENIAIETECHSAAAHVKVDPGQIEQVILNLAVNARDAMPGGGRLRIETAIAEIDEAYSQNHVSAVTGTYVCLTVTDSGEGMDAETQARIFEPFFTTKEMGKGTGLGLAMVYGIVKQSRGNIWVYSEPGRGTTFKVYLPLEREAPAERKNHATPMAITRDGDPRTILLVEDQTPLRVVARRILDRAGYRVIEAAHGEDAIRIADEKAEPIHLVLTDVVMPGMTGPELFRELSTRLPGIRVLFMSGYSESNMGEQGMLDAGTPFLHKPFTVAELTSKVREVLYEG